MSKLNVDQKTIKNLLSDNKADFLIPDYQRPYAWDADKECQTLWEDVFEFAIPEGNANKFNRATDEYYLGPIVTFKNENGQMEIIDGQQRLTTIMLLLRAFYSRFDKMMDADSKQLKEIIGRCIWKTDELDRPDMNLLKINSEVATDNDKEEFLTILKTGLTSDKMKSRYAINYRFFLTKIEEFVNGYPSYFPYLPSRILNNCILLPIEADMQDTALRIFSTLNNRGKALSDADIFKAEFYKFYSKLGRKDQFIMRWRKLDEICERIFHPLVATPMDELFTRYMYYERAKLGIKRSTTEALRSFYGANNYALLQKEETFNNLEILADFWESIVKQDDDRFSKEVLHQLFILNYAPNSMWTFFVSVYFMQKKDVNDQLDNVDFCTFLKRITGFIWAYAITNPGLNALRTPLYAEMVNLVNGKDVEFADFKFPQDQTRNQLNNYNFYNMRPITKSMLVWWAMEQPGQTMPNIDTMFDIEHIYAKNRDHMEQRESGTFVEQLGNKSILEKRINIRASDYRFADKQKYYQGYTNGKGEYKEPTQIKELLSIAKNKTDFTETDIKNRTDAILTTFCEYLKQQNLMQ